MPKIIRTSKAPQPRGVYSQAMVANGFVFVAGQGPINPKTNEFELGDIRSEVRQTMDNLEAILKAAGSSLQDIVQIRVFLARMTDFAAMNEVFQKYFPKNPPARTTVGAGLKSIKVEIDCIAQVRRTRKRK